MWIHWKVKKHLPRGKIIADTGQEELVSEIKELDMKNDILKETIKILKKSGHRSVQFKK